MKKIIKVMTFMILSVLMTINIGITALAAGASMPGTETVRAGDNITVYLYVNDSGKYGLEGTLAYDSSQVTLTGINCNIAGWKLEQNGNTLIVYDDAMSNPINGNVQVLTMTFAVSGNVATGANINISVNNLVATDGSAESNLGTATYKVTVARPLSTNANLSSLSVGGYTLNPAFSSGTVNYDIGEVPFSVTSLNLDYKTEDTNATVWVSGNNLVVGSNTVNVVVTAENGGTKTYNIKVNRQQDPNYVASSNATLSSISPSSGQISPAFSSDVTEYIVYLPYESVGKAFSATGTAADAKANGVTNGEVTSLQTGENIVNVVCKAEDGTEKVYKVTVVVMPEYSGIVPEITGVEKETETEPVTETPTEETEAPSETKTEKETTKKVAAEDNKTSGVSAKWIVISAIIAAIVSGGIGFLVGRKKGNTVAPVFEEEYLELEEEEIGAEVNSEE